MSILVGYGPESRGNAALELGRALAESADLPLAVVCVIPDRWQPVSVARTSDSEYQTYLQDLAQNALSAAREHLQPTTMPVSYDVVTARSAPAGLLQAATARSARILVAGSSSDGAWGHIALGSVTDRLLHSSPVPVAVAPRGHRFGAGQPVTRITVAHDGSDTCSSVLAQAAAVATTVRATLRVVTFAVRPGQMIPSEVGLRAEDEIVAVWRKDSARRIREAVAGLPETDPSTAGSGAAVDTVVAEGRTWAEALDAPGWEPGDVLTVGSSASESLFKRVFLGSTATRIVRHSPVPVVVVP